MKHFDVRKAVKLISYIIFFVSSTTFSQSLQWVNRLGAAGDEWAYSVTSDSFGNIYTTGTMNGEVFVSKIDKNGNIIWTKSTEGSAVSAYGYSIKLDFEGNICVTGLIDGITDFNPDIGVFNLSVIGSYDIFVWKLDNDGNFLWVKKIGDTYSDQGADLVIDEFGSIYIVGVTESTIAVEQIFIAKLDLNGNTIWMKAMGSAAGGGRAQSVALDGSGGIVVTGYFNNSVDFDPSANNYTLTGGGQIFVAKYDTIGNFRWAKQIEGTGYGMGSCINIDSLGDIFLSGRISGSADFDLGAGTQIANVGGNSTTGMFFLAKYDSIGGFIWVKNFGLVPLSGTPSDFDIDNLGNIYLVGRFQGSIDVNPGASTNYLTSVGADDGFFCKINSQGNFVFAERIGGVNYENVYSVVCDDNGDFTITGSFGSNMDFDIDDGTYNIMPNGWGNDVFIAKYSSKGVVGYVYNDVNQNCILESNEIGLTGRTAIINPGNILVQTSNTGSWYLDSLPIGNYSITFNNVFINWQATCPITQYFTVTNSNDITHSPNFGMINTQPCSQPNVSITAPFLRRCFTDQLVYVQACNQNIATGALNSAYVDVELDSLLTPTASSLTYTSMGNNQYRFNVGTLNPGQCVNFTINATVSCAANLQQTLCMEARLFPADTCVFDTISTPTLPPGPGTVTPCNLPWDHSSLSVDGYCANDTVYFTITNNGSASNGNMLCYAPVRVYVDGVLTYTDSIMLGGGQTITYSYPGNGQTWILQADQHPLHPGNSHPNAHVEACGDLTNWTRNLINNFPLDDADPIVDIYCGVVSGAYDPNDKTGFPIGLGTEHEILPNQQLQYLIRFQNTGTDTAFTIVVRDTLDTDLNIFSVVPGVASHNYSFRMYGPHVLEWTFANIMLPDSNVNEATSHGFLTFTVNQQPNLIDGTKILNDADIYFDFNEPVITNETVHTINKWINAYPIGINTSAAIQKSTIKVYPNPTKGSVYVELKDVSPTTEVTVLNVLGQQMSKQQFYNANSCSLIIEGEPGVYFIKVVSGGKTEYVKLLKL